MYRKPTALAVRIGASPAHFLLTLLSAARIILRPNFLLNSILAAQDQIGPGKLGGFYQGQGGARHDHYSELRHDAGPALGLLCVQGVLYGNSAILLKSEGKNKAT